MGIRFDSLQKSSKIHELKARSEFNGGLHHLNVLKAVALVLVILFAYQFANPALSSAAGSLHRRDSGTLANSTLSPASSFDFSLLDSGGITVNPGSSGSNTITVTLVSGPTQGVTLSVSGFPIGGSATFFDGCMGQPTCTVSPTRSVTLTITTSSSTSPGVYIITVKGVGGGLTDTSQF